MGNSQSLPELPPTYDEFQNKYQSQLNIESGCDNRSNSNSVSRLNSYSASSTNYSNSYSTSNNITRSNTYSTSCTIQTPVQPSYNNSIEAKLTDLRNKPNTLNHLLNCKKEDYDTVKSILEMEKNIVKRREKLENYIAKEVKKIEKMEKERDKKLVKISIDSRRRYTN